MQRQLATGISCTARARINAHARKIAPAGFLGHCGLLANIADRFTGRSGARLWCVKVLCFFNELVLQRLERVFVPLTVLKRPGFRDFGLFFCPREIVLTQLCCAQSRNADIGINGWCFALAH